MHLICVSKIANAFEIPYKNISSTKEYESILKNWNKEPLILEIHTNPNQKIQPRQAFKSTNNGFEPEPLTIMDPPLKKESQDIINSFTNKFYLTKNKEVDLIKTYPKSSKSRSKRIINFKSNQLLSESELILKSRLIKEAREYGKEYFDGNRLYGYGEYKYDSSFWKGVAKDIKKFFKLKPGDSLLELGCAKGFLLRDLIENVKE